MHSFLLFLLFCSQLFEPVNRKLLVWGKWGWSTAVGYVSTEISTHRFRFFTQPLLEDSNGKTDVRASECAKFVRTYMVLIRLTAIKL